MVKFKNRTAALVVAVIVIVASIVTLERLLPRTATPSTRASASTLDFSKIGAPAEDTVPIPELTGLPTWLNSEPLTIEGLRGKVVLVDFWTYSCVNCIRTLPYLKQWHQKYADEGLVILGIHTPEFEFEKNVANVRNA